MRSHDNAYKAVLIFSIAVDILLCVGLLVSIIHHISNGKSFSPHYIIGFATFFTLFAIFIISLMIAVHLRKVRAYLLTVVVTVARFLCAIIVVIAWMSDYGGAPEDEKPGGDDNPYTWISHHKFSLIIFTIIYIPIFCIQLYVLNRFYSHTTQRKYIPSKSEPE